MSWFKKLIDYYKVIKFSWHTIFNLDIEYCHSKKKYSSMEIVIQNAACFQHLAVVHVQCALNSWGGCLAEQIYIIFKNIYLEYKL